MELTTNEQQKLVEQLVASTNADQIKELTDYVGWPESFLTTVTQKDVDFYLRRLLLAASTLDKKTKLEQEEKEARVKGQQNSIEGYMSGLLTYVRKQLPSAAIGFESHKVLTKLEVIDSARNLHLLLTFNKKEMMLKSASTTRSHIRAVYNENISKWNGGVAGHEQSHLFNTFRQEIEETTHAE